MMGATIIGTGTCVPDKVVTNNDLAQIMDTTDEWISTRTGVRERRFVDQGVGSSDLAVTAVTRAIADSGLDPSQVDLLVTATMTPDHLAPGIAGLVQRGSGLGHIPAIDIRQQCSGFLYAVDVADAYIGSGRARNAVVVGTEVHAGFLPWSRSSWQKVLGGAEVVLTDDEHARNTEYRSWSVLFGDGAGAMVLSGGGDDGSGILASSLHTDGDSFELIWIPGVGFKERPYVTAEQLTADRHLPVMDGGGLYRSAVRSMPEAVEAVLAKAGLVLDDVDLVVTHQANDRITEGVRRRLGMGPEKVPSNIGSYGNTTAATLPLLYHELRSNGRVAPGTLICFTAFGAGAHYGAILYREPREATTHSSTSAHTS
jgi:3-oxoacyl-[acyl-carrier-protein] synthase-3